MIDLTADQRTAVRFALALCREETFSTLDVDNRVTAKRLTAHQAVASGDAFFGSCRPEVWGIDIDGPSHPAVQYLRYVIAWTGVESLECLSGRGHHRHLFVAVKDEADRDFIQEQILVAFPNLPPEVIDWRRQRTGSAIRPPGAPHRFGGRSEPVIDIDEALEIVESWCELQQPAPASVENCRLALPLWAEAARGGDFAAATALGYAAPSKPDGTVDRSRVDMSLALAYVNANRPCEEFVADRRPGGRWPSGHAQHSSDPDGYLWRTFANAERRGPLIPSHRAGLDQLDRFVQTFESDPNLAGKDRQILMGVVSLCEAYGKTTVAFSYRQLVEASLGGLRTVSETIQSGRLSPYLSAPIEPTEEGWANTSEYRLLVLEALGKWSSLEQSGSHTPGTGRLDCSGDDPTLRIHPVFSDMAGGLGQKAFETLKSFSDCEGLTVAEAGRRATGRVGSTAHKKWAARFSEIGALVSDLERPKLKRRAAGFDWDAVAIELGVHDIRNRLAERHRRDRREFVRAKQQHGLSAAEAVDEFAALARGRAITNQADHADGRTAVRFGTDEIIGTDPVMVVRRSTNTGSCRACGCGGATLDPQIGLRRHHGCLFAPWMADIERRHGASIPDELIRRLSPITDWGEFGPDPSSPPGNVLELPAMPAHAVVA